MVSVATAEAESQQELVGLAPEVLESGLQIVHWMQFVAVVAVVIVSPRGLVEVLATLQTGAQEAVLPELKQVVEHLLMVVEETVVAEPMVVELVHVL